MDQQNQIQSVVSTGEEGYVPSSVEKKRALMMYFLFGIIIVIADKKVNDFEFFHVKQAMGWWMVFILSMLISIIILFIPLIKFLGILWLFLVMIIFGILAKQAWDGKYHQDVTKYSLGIFPSLGAWLFGLFGIDLNKQEIAGLSSPNVDQNQQTQQPDQTNQNQ